MDLGILSLAQPGLAVVVLAILLLAEGLHPFAHHFRSGGERSRHALRNLALGLANGVLVALVFAGLWVATAEWTALHEFGILYWARPPQWAHVVGAVLLLDVWTYAWHRMNHRIPALWRLHRVHHADAHMDVTTASRFHTGEIVLSSLLRIPVLALIGATAWELVLYETMMFAVVQFHHANLGLPSWLDRALRAVIVTPTMHKVHHSRWQPETDSNYSSLFSWWDRIFGSFRTHQNPENIALGLNGMDGDEHQSVAGMLKLPLADFPMEREDEA